MTDSIMGHVKFAFRELDRGFFFSFDMAAPAAFWYGFCVSRLGVADTKGEEVLCLPCASFPRREREG